jgi:hypothetical protein
MQLRTKQGTASAYARCPLITDPVVKVEPGNLLNRCTGESVAGSEGLAQKNTGRGIRERSRNLWGCPQSQVRVSPVAAGISTDAYNYVPYGNFQPMQ